MVDILEDTRLLKVEYEPEFPSWNPGFNKYTPNRLRWSFFHPFHSERLPQPAKGSNSCPFRVQENQDSLILRQSLIHPHVPLLLSTCLLVTRRPYPVAT